MKKPKIIIVGAGLAGLAAAYELAKSNKYTVEIFEALDRTGGRVHSMDVRGIPIDFGGFIIYPWYETYHRLINELNIAHLLSPIEMKPILYEINEPKHYISDQDITFPPTDTVKLWAKSAPGIFLNDDIAEPKLNTYYDKTISQYMREVLGRPEHAGIYETFTDIVSQGYCYGPVDQYRAAFITPIIRYTKLHGDIRSAFYFKNGNNIVPQALTRYIQDRGVIIHYESPVIGVGDQSILTSAGEHSADAVIFAQPVSSQIYGAILPQHSINITYTHFYTATLRFDKNPTMPHYDEWGAVFYKPDPSATYQIVSSINLQSLYDQALSGLVNVNIRVLPEANDTHPLTQEELYERIRKDVQQRFPGLICSGIETFVHWPNTMPISSEDFVRAVRSINGTHKRYFAGDFLGGPSMETALQTGVRVAHRVMRDSTLE